MQSKQHECYIMKHLTHSFIMKKIIGKYIDMRTISFYHIDVITTVNNVNENFCTILNHNRYSCKDSFVVERFISKCINHFANIANSCYHCPTIYVFESYFYLVSHSFHSNLLTLYSVKG